MVESPEIGSAEELAALFPGARVLRVIEPLDAADNTKARKAATVIVRPLTAIEAAQFVVRMKPLFEAYKPEEPAIQLIGEHMPMVLELAAAATDRPAEWLGNLDAGDTLAVLIAVIDANENFLRVVVDLTAGPTKTRLAAIFLSDGPTPSSSSPNTVSRKPLSSLRPRSTP